MGDCNVQCTCCTEHGRYGLSCLYAETVESMSSASWVCMVCMVCIVCMVHMYMYMVCLICWSLSYVVKLIGAEHVRYGSMKDCGVSIA